MWSRLVRPSVQACRCLRSSTDVVNNSVAFDSTFHTRIELRTHEAWEAQVTELEIQPPEKLAQFARVAYPRNRVLWVDPGQAFSQLFHATFYVAMKNLGHFRTPAQVLPLLALWLSYPPQVPDERREDDYYTQELCRHLMAMAAQLTSSDVAELLDAFRAPHVKATPEPVLKFASCWIDATSPRLKLDDIIVLLRVTAGAGSCFNSFFDLCCRRLLEAVGDGSVTPTKLADCLYRLSQCQVWSEQLVAQGSALLMAGDVQWTSDMCHHVIRTFFNLGCLQEDVIRSAIAHFEPDMERSSGQCLDFLHCCQLFELYPDKAMSAMRVWLELQDADYWENGDGVALIEQLLLLEITWTMSHPNQPSLLSDRLLTEFLRNSCLKLARGKVSPGSILRYPHVYDCVARTAGSNSVVATEVLVFTLALDMMLVLDGNGLMMSNRHPSTAAPPLIPLSLATRIRSSQALSLEQIEKMAWTGSAFRAIAINVCEAHQHIRRTVRVNGETALKEKVLSQLGYEVIRVRLDECGRFDREGLATALKSRFVLPPKRDKPSWKLHRGDRR